MDSHFDLSSPDRFRASMRVTLIGVATNLSLTVTQIFIGHSQRTGLWSRLLGNPVDQLIRRSQGMDVRVFPQ